MGFWSKLTGRQEVFVFSNGTFVTMINQGTVPEGIYEDATNHAVKRVLAWQVEKAMQDAGITKTEMARRMGTSRAHLDRLLDPENDKVQLDTVQRAATAVGRRLRLVLV